MTTRITALMTCHNRRASTLSSLDALFSADRPEAVQVDAVLVDDGSKDGTTEAVRSKFSAVRLLEGNGDLFWCRGMHRAHAEAVRSVPEFVLWLNDDTLLHADAITNLLNVYNTERSASNDHIVVAGTTVDPDTGAVTYGGLRAASRLRPFSFSKIPVGKRAQLCEAMNGNVVLVPRAVYERVGAFDAAYEHALGDIDYALRARARGARVILAPGVQGTCKANSTAGTHLDDDLPVRVRWKRFIGRKGLPPKSWLHFARRHAGLAWPVFFLYPYLKFSLKLLISAMFRWRTRFANR